MFSSPAYGASSVAEPGQPFVSPQAAYGVPGHINRRERSRGLRVRKCGNIIQNPVVQNVSPARTAARRSTWGNSGSGLKMSSDSGLGGLWTLIKILLVIISPVTACYTSDLVSKDPTGFRGGHHSG